MRPSRARVYDVSRPLHDGGTIYPGDPEIRFQPHTSIARGDDANVTALALGSHSGTHVDAPSHFIPGGEPVDRIAVERLIGPAVVLDLPDAMSVGATELARQDLQGRRRVLLRTRNSARPQDTGFTPDYCALSPDGARYLLERDVELVGIDALSIEPFGSVDFAVHHLLLERGVVIVEGLDLSAVPAGACEFICLPLRLQGLDGAPARAVLIAGGADGPAKA
jgi:arylformamidase